MVGSEELAIFERRGDGLELLQAFGVDPGPMHEMPSATGRSPDAAHGALSSRAAGSPGAADPDLTARSRSAVGEVGSRA